MTTAKRFEYLVVDTGPLLTGSVQPGSADYILTIPEVLDEIKDRETKERLSSGLLQLKTRQPSAEGLRLAIDASQKTGDFAVLSKTDLKLVALCITLEMELNPERKGFDVRGGAKVHQTVPPRQDPDADRPDSSNAPAEEPSEKPLPTSEPNGSSGSGQLADEGEWITPENLASKLAKDADKPHPTVSVKLACMTGDFAVQNLLLALKLKLYSPDGKRVRSLKSHLLRCHGCFWTTLDMAKRFCDKCGGVTLLRASYSVDTSGSRHIYLRADYRHNLRGSKYSLPRPKGGRQGDIVLRADQAEYQRALRRQEQEQDKIRRLDEEDAIEERLAAVFGDMKVSKSGGNKFVQQGGRLTIGMGRRNPNEARR